LIEKINNNIVEIKRSNELLKEIYGINQKIILCGHSHTQNIITINSNQFIINPGSVGLQAFEDDLPSYHKIETKSPHAKYCLIELNDNKYAFEFVKVMYDWKKASACAKENNRLDWFNWLNIGFAAYD
jgi:Icc-related predicted phosphoesterase